MTKSINFVVISIFLFLTGIFSGLGSDYILVHLSDSVSGLSDNITAVIAAESITTEDENVTSLLNNTNTTSTTTASDINGSLTTLTPQELQDRRHAPS